MTFDEIYEEFKDSFYYRFKKYIWLERDDAVQIASIGLYKAYIKYNINYGYDFSTFAARCIDMEFKNCIRKRTNEEKLKADNNISVISLEDTYHFSDKNRIEDVTPDEIDNYKQLLDKMVIEQSMQSLSEKEHRTIIDIYYKDIGLDCIAKKEKITKQGIKRRKDVAIKKMKRVILRDCGYTKRSNKLGEKYNEIDY